MQETSSYHHLVWLCVHSAPRYTGVGLLFICIRAVQSLSSDKRIAPHFLYIGLSDIGAYRAFLRREMKQNYDSPRLEEFKVMPMASLLQNTSPGINPGGDVPPSGDGGDE